MIIPEDYEYNHDIKISDEEYEVIKKFLAFYRNQSVIVADSYRQDFDTVPLENDRIIFKTYEDTWKSIDFCKRIYHKGKPYVVGLGLDRAGYREDTPKCLSIHDFRIITNGKVHIINLDTNDVLKGNILFNIISVFDEKKIISPEQAYSKRMYTNKALQGFIKNHEWEKIDTGIKQMPRLANALFIVRDEGCFNYTADFGTILYQLVSFRKSHLNDFGEKDLKKLDKLILKLSKNELLKVQLHERVESGKSYPTPTSILLESNNFDSRRIHESRQYTVDNTELLAEHKTLNKCIRSLTPERK